MKSFFRGPRRILAGLALLVLVLGVSGKTLAAGSPSVTFFAAASTTNAITEIGRLFQSKTGVNVVLSFASSSTLARQIELGAPAHIYLSANPKWMDYLAERGRIVNDSRVDLLGNRIVLVAPKDNPVSVALKPGVSITGLLGDGRLVMGDPDHVPAGIYGKEALESLGLWKDLERRVAGAKDVRAALALVERGEAVLGLVYATDAAISRNVRVVAVVPAEHHSPIVYPVALVAGGNTPEAGNLLEFLKSPEAEAVFRKYGFAVP